MYFCRPMAIHFHTTDVPFRLMHKSQLKRWITLCASHEQRRVGTINIIFCSDDYLLDINKKHLSHDYYTDIITFDYSSKQSVSGDLFISVHRVQENSLNLSASFEKELYRVIIHGVMHLCGYGDKTKKELAIMRSREDFHLSQISNFI